MEYVFLGVGGVLMLVALVCFILVIVKMFQNQMTGLAIGSIIGFFFCFIGHILALIYGWQNKVAWGLQKVMPIYSICFALGLVFYGIGYAIMIPKMAKDFQEQQQQISEEYGDTEFVTPEMSSESQ